MEDLGLKLKTAREARGMTVSEVAALTKISVQTIKDIEDNTLDREYAPIYAKGFIKLYAEAVGVPQDELSQCVSKSKPARGAPAAVQESSAMRVAVMDRLKTFTGEAVGQLRELSGRLRKLISPDLKSGGESGTEVSTGHAVTFKERACALLSQANISRKALRTLVICLVLAGVAVAFAVGTRRLITWRLMKAASGFEVLREPPAPYIE